MTLFAVRVSLPKLIGSFMSAPAFKKNKYRAGQWAVFREEVIELDGWKCVRCGRARDDGVVLQVHHKKYLKDRAPWEYPTALCETLCKGCHGQEHGVVRPDSGWEYVGEDDLGDVNETCDLCGTEIRFVFFVQHPNWEPLSVGTVCCDVLTGTKIATERRKFEERLARFMKSTRWQQVGQSLCITQKQIDIRLAPVAGGFRIHMNTTKGKKIYPDLEAAKERVFDFIESGEADDFFGSKA